MLNILLSCHWRSYIFSRGRPGRDRDRLLGGFTTTCAISAYHN